MSDDDKPEAPAPVDRPQVDQVFAPLTEGLKPKPGTTHLTS